MRTTNSPADQPRKAFKANWTVFIYKMLKWRSLFSWDQMPAPVRSRKCVPQLVNNASVYRRRGGDTWSGIPDVQLSSWSHQMMHSLHSSDKGTSTAGLSEAGDQWIFSCPWEQTDPGMKWGLKAAATSCPPDPRIWQFESAWKSLSQMVSISIPRYWALLDNEVWLLPTGDNPKTVTELEGLLQVATELEELLLMFQKERNQLRSHQLVVQILQETDPSPRPRWTPWWRPGDPSKGWNTEPWTVRPSTR